MSNQDQVISRRQFGLAAGLVAAGATTLPAGMLKRAQAADRSTRIDNALVIGLSSSAGGTHTLVTHNDGRVTIQLLEGPAGAIIVDSGEAPQYAQSALQLAKSLNKPIDGVFISHDHPDHTGGLSAYEGVPIMTTSGILANITNGPFPKPSNLDQITAFDDAEISIGGLSLKIHNYKNAEAKEQIVIEAPALDTAVVQDLVYNNCYLFPGMDRPNWISVLEDLQQSLDVQNLLVGHGYPASSGELTAAIDYLNEYHDLVARSADGEELAAKLKARWPDHLGEGLLKLQGFAFAG
jgi:glyoxylase-like metal-dependent hydrolase (beta-lactamase superfamily II)